MPVTYIRVDHFNGGGSRKNKRPGGTARGRGGPSGGQRRQTIQDVLERAVGLHNQGSLAQAEGLYHQILQAEPDHSVALNLLGVIAHAKGDDDRAEALISKSIAIRPDNPDALNNLANIHSVLGRHNEAEASYRKALAITPDDPEMHNNLANTLVSLGRADEAVALCQKAIALSSAYPEPHNNLGNAFMALGRLGDAVAAYRDAIALRPDYLEAHNNLGIACTDLGRTGEAVSCHRRAIALDPAVDASWTGFAAALEYHQFDAADDGLMEDLLRLVEHPSISPHFIAPQVLSALRLHPEIGRLLRRNPGAPPRFAEAAETLSSVPLLLRVMALSSINDHELEALLTGLRRALLEAAVSGDENTAGLPFAAALALHCFTNEYVFAETAEETAALAGLEPLLAAAVADGGDIPAHGLVALGAYRPLHAYPWAGALIGRACADEIAELIERTIAEPLEERRLQAEIPRLTAIVDDISRTVRAQYEENPYPRWIRTRAPSKAGRIGDVLGGKPLFLELGDYVSPEHPDILIAGCGTGQHAIGTAARFAGARVLAVDLSLASLAYATRQSRALAISNIEYAQADIMELGQLDRRFDLIESSGVLHHLGDPLAGWRVLVGLLRPGGMMKIALYSEIARQDVAKGRALVRARGYTASAEDIRRFRQDVLVGGRLPELASVTRIRDFYSLSECRDLLFHVQEHTFTLPAIEDALKALGLTFLGLEISNHVRQAFRVAHPEDGAVTRLAAWHAFERDNPGTFLGMYQFWCRRT